MPEDQLFESKHFTLHPLTDGVYACVHQPGGAAYSNAGIIDLGDRTLVVDAFDTLAAGRDLRRAAETLLDRPVETIALTHPHSDHWIGASAFDPHTTLLSSHTTRQVCLEWGAEILEERQNPAIWEDQLQEMQAQLRTETDERARIGLENAIARTRYAMVEMTHFQPRYADLTFEDRILFQGRKRKAELVSFGRGHSEDDAALLLPHDGIAFIGDIGFFDTQPFLGFCDLDLYRQQSLTFQESDFQVLVPGHGPVGGKDNLAIQLKYFETLEGLVGEVVDGGGSLEEALHISLPEPFNAWLRGGLARFEVNVRYLFERLGGEMP
jgi:cyclase